MLRKQLASLVMVTVENRGVQLGNVIQAVAAQAYFVAVPACSSSGLWSN